MSEYPHRMQLRPPWNRESLPSGVRLIRRFGRPNHLDDFERVWLTGTQLDGPCLVRLNGDVLGPSHNGHFAFDITNRMLPRNEIALDFTAQIDASQFEGEIVLEVRCPAWFQDVLVASTQPPLLVGTLAGESDQALDIYAIADRSTVGYRTIQPFADRLKPTPFELPLDVTTLQPTGLISRLRVELVQGAVVWDRRDLHFTSDT